MRRRDQDNLRERIKRLEQVVLRLCNLIERYLGATLEIGETQMARIDDLVREVQEQSTVVGSVEVLIQGLKSDLQAARDELAQQGGDTARLDAAIASIDQNTGRLQAAAATGTAAEKPEQDDIHSLSM